jgi:hypothetical protein
MQHHGERRREPTGQNHPRYSKTTCPAFLALEEMGPRKREQQRASDLLAGPQAEAAPLELSLAGGATRPSLHLIQAASKQSGIDRRQTRSGYCSAAYRLPSSNCGRKLSGPLLRRSFDCKQSLVPSPTRLYFRKHRPAFQMSDLSHGISIEKAMLAGYIMSLARGVYS